MLETLGNLGDFLGGAGVLVSLIYLAIQIRHNTTAGKADSYQAVVSAVSDWSREVGADADLCRVILKGQASSASLEPVERMQFSLTMASFFRHMENVHAKFESGSVDERVWDGWAARTRAFLVAPGTADWWRSTETAYSSSFRKWADEPFDSEGLPMGLDTFLQPNA
jgi:hypothetical protein